ncbi:MAG: hypothetical protein WEE67_04160 [Chloroflexota bacterium]
MTARQPTAEEIERAFARARSMQAELVRRERAVGRKIQTLARALAALMEPGEHFHRVGVGLHAFDADGTTCLAAAYLEEVGDDYRYRYAVLCGGEAAKRALRSAALDPGDSDDPGPSRRVALATYSDYDNFLYRLPKYVSDVERGHQARLARLDRAEERIRDARRQLTTVRRRYVASRPSDGSG